MLKYIIGFIAFAVLGIWLLMRPGSDIDLSGEKHDTGSHTAPAHDAAKAPAAAPATAAPAAPAPAPAKP
jgi:hypothetical protein